jgi:hypothetical protein
MPKYETRIIIFSDIDKKEFSHHKKIVCQKERYPKVKLS